MGSPFTFLFKKRRPALLLALLCMAGCREQSPEEDTEDPAMAKPPAPAVSTPSTDPPTITREQE